MLVADAVVSTFFVVDTVGMAGVVVVGGVVAVLLLVLLKDAGVTRGKPREPPARARQPRQGNQHTR